MKSSRENKKLEERIILQFFSYAFHDFPMGKIIDSESPDFIVRQSPKRSMGIELTRLTVPNGYNSSFDGVKVDSHERTVCELARNIFETNRDLKLYVDIFFKPDINIEDTEQLKIAENIALDIDAGIDSPKLGSVFQIELENPSSSSVIDYIQVTYFPGIEESRWDNAGRYFVPELSRELITDTIQSKEEKLPLYQKKKIDDCWLILFTNSFKRSTSFNIHNKVNTWNIYSDFDRVFLFELIDFKVNFVK